MNMTPFIHTYMHILFDLQAFSCLCTAQCVGTSSCMRMHGPMVSSCVVIFCVYDDRNSNNASSLQLFSQLTNVHCFSNG